LGSVEMRKLDDAAVLMANRASTILDNTVDETIAKRHTTRHDSYTTIEVRDEEKVE
jgi:hypothetical protein